MSWISHRDGLVDLIKGMVKERGSIKEAFEEFENLVDEHFENHQTSRLSQLVPRMGKFFTPLPVQRALTEYDLKYGISARTLIPISFRETRHILNTAQIHALSSDVRLVTFDADNTLYVHGENMEEDNPMIPLILRLLERGVCVAIVTAAGYPHAPHRYVERFHGLINALSNPPASIDQDAILGSEPSPSPLMPPSNIFQPVGGAPIEPVSPPTTTPAAAANQNQAQTSSASSTSLLQPPQSFPVTLHNLQAHEQQFIEANLRKFTEPGGISYEENQKSSTPITSQPQPPTSTLPSPSPLRGVSTAASRTPGSAFTPAHAGATTTSSAIKKKSQQQQKSSVTASNSVSAAAISKRSDDSEEGENFSDFDEDYPDQPPSLGVGPVLSESNHSVTFIETREGNVEMLEKGPHGFERRTVVMHNHQPVASVRTPQSPCPPDGRQKSEGETGTYTNEDGSERMSDLRSSEFRTTTGPTSSQGDLDDLSVDERESGGDSPLNVPSSRASVYSDAATEGSIAFRREIFDEVGSELAQMLIDGKTKRHSFAKPPEITPVPVMTPPPESSVNKTVTFDEVEVRAESPRSVSSSGDGSSVGMSGTASVISDAATEGSHAFRKDEYNEVAGEVSEVIFSSKDSRRSAESVGVGAGAAGSSGTIMMDDEEEGGIPRYPTSQRLSITPRGGDQGDQKTQVPEIIRTPVSGSGNPGLSGNEAEAEAAATPTISAPKSTRSANDVYRAMCDRFFVLGGECNYLFKVDFDKKALVEVPDQEWKTPELLAWSQKDIDEILDGAESILREKCRALRIQDHLVFLRKERALGAYPVSGYKVRTEALNELALSVQQGVKGRIPYCAFNSGVDVWVDIGNKAVGVEVLQQLIHATPASTMHVGDQFTFSGNDIAARHCCSTLWVNNPKESHFFISLLLSDLTNQGATQQ